LLADASDTNSLTFRRLSAGRIVSKREAIADIKCFSDNGVPPELIRPAGTAIVNGSVINGAALLVVGGFLRVRSSDSIADEANFYLNDTLWTAWI